MKSNTTNGLLVFGVFVLIGLFAFMIFGGVNTTQTIISTGGVSQEATTVSNSLLTGEAGTVTVKDYDRENNARNTEIAGTWYVLDNGQLIVNNAAVTSIDTSVGSPLVFYGSGTTYYGDKKEYSLNGITTGTVSLDAHTIAAEAAMNATGYDNTGAAALTADDDSENTADYSLTLGSGGQDVYYVKWKNADDQSLFKLKAICTFYPSNGNVSDNKLVDADFTEVAIPLYLKNSIISVNNDTASSAFLSYYKHCYVYKAGTESTIDLAGWAYTKTFQFVVEAVSGVNPTENEGNNVGAIVFDAAYTLGNDGKIWYDFYTHDTNEYTNTVGMAETITSPQGKETGIVVELI